MDAILSIISLFAFVMSFVVLIYVLSVIPSRLNAIKKQNEQIYKILEYHLRNKENPSKSIKE